MQYCHPVFDRLQYCKRSETGQWERILQVIKNWTVGRPGNVLQAIKNLTVGRPWNEAILSDGYMMGYSGDAQLELLAGFKSHLRSEV